jgi:hypothetical protein
MCVLKRFVRELNSRPNILGFALPSGSCERQISTTMLNGFVAIEEAFPREIQGEKVTRWM